VAYNIPAPGEEGEGKMNEICIMMAAEMLGIPVPELDKELVRRLLRVDELTKKVRNSPDTWDGGFGLALRSRQTVAVIVEQWEREEC
jgi:hypothetical protein